MFTDEDIEIFVSYAIGNDEKFREMTGGNIITKRIVANLMNDKLKTAMIREQIVAHVLGLRHVYHMHGDTPEFHEKQYDAYDDKNQNAYEIKTEQHSNVAVRKTNKQQVIGTGMFSSVQKQDNADKLISDNPMIAHAGFYNGRLGFIATFRYNDSDAPTRVQQYLDSREERGKKTTPRYYYKDWIKCPGLEFQYFNGDLIFSHKDHVAGNLAKIFYERKVMDKVTERTNPV